MLIGVPKEIKSHEYRVGLTPSSVRELIHLGHEVLVETGAGLGINRSDKDYTDVGAKIAKSAEEVFAKAEMIVKVKEPQPNECKMLRSGQVLFTYLHLAADLEQAKGLMDSGCIAIAYETVTSNRGTLPLLVPMSEVAGRMSVQAGAHCLEKSQGGRGILLGGVPGVYPAKVVILGGGVVGTHAARMAVGLGADVTIIDRSMPRLGELDQIFEGRVKTQSATMRNIEYCVAEADLVIGAVLIPGAAAPKLITESMVKGMKEGSVIVDVAIDQGGCIETSRPTTHQDPTFVKHGVVHYCVTNMPGGVPYTSAYALNNVTLPFVTRLAEDGYKEALLADKYFLEGLNVCNGKITHEAVALELGLPYCPPLEALNCNLIAKKA